MKSMAKVFMVLALVAVICLPGVASASSTFFGEDLNGGNLPPSHPNADAAQTSFLAALASYGTETFDSIQSGTVSSIPLNFGWVTGTATVGTGTLGVTNVAAGGRYPISGANYLELVDYTYTGLQVNSIVTFNFTSGQSVGGFGFYGIDIGDFGERLQVALTYTDSTQEIFQVPHTYNNNNANAGVLYFGVIGSKAISSINLQDVHVADGNYPAMGFDNFTAGAVPLPPSMLLLGTGLLGLVGLRWRKGKATV